jgi:hypothetical protein
MSGYVLFAQKKAGSVTCKGYVLRYACNIVNSRAVAAMEHAVGMSQERVTTALAE